MTHHNPTTGAVVLTTSPAYDRACQRLGLWLHGFDLACSCGATPGAVCEWFEGRASFHLGRASERYAHCADLARRNQFARAIDGGEAALDAFLADLEPYRAAWLALDGGAS